MGYVSTFQPESLRKQARNTKCGNNLCLSPSLFLTRHRLSHNNLAKLHGCYYPDSSMRKPKDHRNLVAWSRSNSMGKNKTVIRVFWFQTLLLFLLWDKACSTAMQERWDLFQKARWTNSCNTWSLGRIFKGSVLLTSLHFLYPTVRMHIQTHIPKPPERPVKVRNWTIIHCRYIGVGNLENNYAATYTYLIN